MWIFMRMSINMQEEEKNSNQHTCCWGVVHINMRELWFVQTREIKWETSKFWIYTYKFNLQTVQRFFFVLHYKDLSCTWCHCCHNSLKEKKKITLKDEYRNSHKVIYFYSVIEFYPDTLLLHRTWWGYSSTKATPLELRRAGDTGLPISRNFWCQ